MPCLPLLTVRTKELHPLPVSSYGIALLLDETLSSEDLPRLDGLIRGQRPFMLMLGSGIGHQHFEYITLCLFSPAYIRQGEAPVLVFQSAAPDGLLLHLHRQGWPDTVQWNISRIPRLTQYNDIPEVIDTWLTGNHILGKYLLVQGKDLDDTLLLEQGLRRDLTGILNDQPVLRTLIQQKFELQQRLDQQANDNKVLRERLQNTEGTVSLIRHKYKDDYNILYNWYQDQYEVLPLWYKRVGHLVKVITGKRSFKSLAASAHKKLHRWRASTKPKNSDK